jgi:hypothetical protein
MDRPSRKRQPKIWFDEQETYAVPPPVKKTKKKCVELLETAPVIQPPPSSLQELLDTPTPQFTPPFPNQNEPFKVLCKERDPLSLLMYFLSVESIWLMCNATNERAELFYAENECSSRPWSLVTPQEFYRWLALVFYMSNAWQTRRQDYWRDTELYGHKLGRLMSRDRWEQIHRFWCINNAPRQPEDPWWYKIEPIMTGIRQRCREAFLPSSWISIDESMIAFSGRSPDTVKMPNKPIKQGYKVWILGLTGGAIYDWLMHSNIDKTECCYVGKRFKGPPNIGEIVVPPTQQVPLILCENLRARHPLLNCTVFLDNLFLNIPVAHALLALGIGVTGTTRKTAAGIPRILTDVKDLKQAIRYGGILAIEVDNVLCFAWQDNNVVLCITTSYSVHRPVEDFIVKKRWNPRITSTNADIARPVFGAETSKILPIPVAINDYNHGMNSVDAANQLRREITVARPKETRTWRPLAYWLIDVCTVNSFVIWRQLQPDYLRKRKNLHKVFMETLIDQILAVDPILPLPLSPLVLQPIHGLIGMEKRGRCAWGIRAPHECPHTQERHEKPPTQGSTRSGMPLGEVVNGVTPRTRARLVSTYCIVCKVYLCKDRGCYKQWHVNLRVNA